MNTCTFYRLLDNELPRALYEATRLLSKAKLLDPSVFDGSSFCLFNVDRSDYSGSCGEGIESLFGGRLGKPGTLGRLGRLKGLRNHLIQLSTAFAITRHDSFACLANRILDSEIVGTDLLSRDEWGMTYHFEKETQSESDFCLSIVEIVLSVELLSHLGRIDSADFEKIREVLATRLRQLEAQVEEKMKRKERFARALESVTLSLFLGKEESFYKTSFFFHDTLSRLMNDILDEYECEESKSVIEGDLLFCADCYFALAHWLEVGSSVYWKLVELVFERLQCLFKSNSLDENGRGAWVIAQSRSKAMRSLDKSSALLVLGETSRKPQLIERWFEASIVEGLREEEDEERVMKQPLLWFSTEDWDYQPFSSFRRSHEKSIKRPWFQKWDFLCKRLQGCGGS